MDSLDALREARRASLDDLDLGGPRDRLDAELAAATPRRSATPSRVRRPLVIGTGLLAAGAAAAAIIALVAGGSTAPTPDIAASPAPSGPLLTEAPDLTAAYGDVLHITETRQELEYVQPNGQMASVDGSDQTRANAEAAYRLETAEEYFLPGDPDADALIRSTTGSANGGSTFYMTGVYGDEKLAADTWANWAGAPPPTEPMVHDFHVPAVDRNLNGMVIPTGSLFARDVRSLPTTEEWWVEYWHERAPEFSASQDVSFTALDMLSDTMAFALAAPEMRVNIINSLTQLPGMEWSQEGSTVVFHATGEGRKFSPRPAGAIHQISLTVDLDRAVITDYQDFSPSPESPIVPADVPDVHIRTVIDSAGSMPTD